MATLLDQVFMQNLFAVFGGSFILVGLFGFGLFAYLIFRFKMPITVAAPFMIMLSITIGAIIPELIIVSALVAGTSVGLFLYSLWSGR